MLTIQQTVTIPADRRIFFDLPDIVPTGKTTIALIFSAPEPVAAKKDTSADGGGFVDSAAFPTIAELKAEAARKTAKRLADPSMDSFRRYAGCLATNKTFEGDPVEIQRKMRDEWD
ncbi:MAG: hypothetical protein Ta2A_08100 [Treponemataceae bacterium]|nr:MAG: hypothetical protein Ta2A_08100 [Treponemataceae bacterium]